MQIGLAAPSKTASYFFKNADADEMIFIHKGAGTLKTMFGAIPFEYGDYLIIPRRTVYILELDTTDNRFLFYRIAWTNNHTTQVPQRLWPNAGTLTIL